MGKVHTETCCSIPLQHDHYACAPVSGLHDGAHDTQAQHAFQICFHLRQQGYNNAPQNSERVGACILLKNSIKWFHRVTQQNVSVLDSAVEGHWCFWPWGYPSGRSVPICIQLACPASIWRSLTTHTSVSAVSWLACRHVLNMPRTSSSERLVPYSFLGVVWSRTPSWFWMAAGMAVTSAPVSTLERTLVPPMLTSIVRGPLMAPSVRTHMKKSLVIGGAAKKPSSCGDNSTSCRFCLFFFWPKVQHWLHVASFAGHTRWACGSRPHHLQWFPVLKFGCGSIFFPGWGRKKMKVFFLGNLQETVSTATGCWPHSSPCWRLTCLFWWSSRTVVARVRSESSWSYSDKATSCSPTTRWSRMSSSCRAPYLQVSASL